MCLNEDGVLCPLDDLPVETRSRIRRLINVRDAVRDCLRSQLDGSGEERLLETREQLNYAYDRFLALYGPINATVNQRAFHGDPDLPLLLSLENYDEETRVAVKASIFRERTIHHKQPVQSVGSPKEALLVSLNEKGRVDLNHMTALLARPATDFLPDLKGMVFLNPETKQWETEDHYLSGNVREKLVAADSASVVEVRFLENVEALKSVQPADLPATEIDVRLGASWLPPADVQDFVHGLLGVPAGVGVGHIHALGSWHVTANWEAKGATGNTTDWGHADRYTALELIEETLNLKTPTVYDYVEKKPVVNAQSTEAAREKQERIKERFKEWIWSDDSRRERLVRLYNDSFNHSRVRTFNGEHLTLPGASADVQLHSHQKAGVWRILQTVAQHAARSRRRRGQDLHDGCGGNGIEAVGVDAQTNVHRPEPHARPVFPTELLMLYPGANILVAGKEDFESQHRKKSFQPHRHRRIGMPSSSRTPASSASCCALETQERFFKEQLGGIRENQTGTRQPGQPAISERPGKSQKASGSQT